MTDKCPNCGAWQTEPNQQKCQYCGTYLNNEPQFPIHSNFANAYQQDEEERQLRKKLLKARLDMYTKYRRRY